jgi:hypothetical protein
MKLRIGMARITIAGLAIAAVLRSPIAAQVEAWRAGFDVGASNSRTFFEFFGLPSLPPQQSAMANDGSHYSIVSVIDGGFHSLLVRHDSNGAVSWSRALDGNGIGAPVAVDDEGNAYVGEGSYRCAAVEKFDAMGNLLWTAVAEDAPACDYYWSYLLVEEDAVYAGGVFRSAEALIVARFDTAGEHEWTFVREVEPGSQTNLTGLAVDTQGALLVSGSFWNPTTDYLMFKIDGDGDLAWERSFDFGSQDFAWSIVAGPEDRVTVSGWSYGPEEEGGLDYHTIQYDADGNELWSGRIERETYFGHFWWNPISPALATDSAGHVYLTGSVGPEGAAELILVKYDVDGDELFRQRLPQYAEGRTVVLDDQDRPFVTAPVLSGDLRLATVVAFDTDGSVRWQTSTEEAYYVMPSSLSLRGGQLVMAATRALNEQTISEDTFWLGLDEDGNVKWQAGEPVRGLSDSFCGASDVFNRAGSCLALDSEGSVHLGGSSVDSLLDFSLHHRAVKLSADGSLDWTRAFALPGDDVSGQGAVAMGLAVTDTVHLAGHDFISVGYDEDGNEVWTQVVAEGGEVRATVADSTGAAYVLGRVQGDMLDLKLQKLQPDGNKSWSVGYTGPGHGNDDARAMIVTSGDRIVYVGQASVPGRLDGLVRAHDTDANVVFSNTIASVGDTLLSALIADGGTIVAAGTAGSANDLDALVVRLDYAGNVEWRRDLDGDSGAEPGDDEAAAVAVDPAGNAYVAGRTWNGDDFDVFVVKLDPAGTELWRRAIDFGHGDDEAWSATFDAPGAGGAAGSLWIAGRASNGNDTDALTLRLDSNGNELFRAVVAGTEQRDDEHYDLVVGPPGHATVAGVSAEIDESYNFQAIRYVTSPLDVDYDGEASPLNDGILIMRWLFGFRGSVLTADAVDTALCVRCPAETIDVHLSAIEKMLDVDGNSAADPLTDGTLIFRWLFGFKGAPLIAGAVDLAHCTRCDAPAIEAYLQSLAD